MSGESPKVRAEVDRRLSSDSQFSSWRLRLALRSGVHSCGSVRREFHGKTPETGVGGSGVLEPGHPSSAFRVERLSHLSLNLF